MPKILEMKQIDGTFWCRVDIDNYLDKTQSISLYTEKEIKNLLFQERLAIREGLLEYMKGLM